MSSEPNLEPAIEHDDDDVVISARSVGKCYHIYNSPGDRIKQLAMRRWKTYYRPFWALRGVDFELKRGEAIGIIGRNGSGKSTLMQIIAGTLAPSEGEVVIRGRVAALLELASGFNPEFTGRENVMINGAILGITKRDMQARLGEILEFADIGDFVDQPVKTYSSGMRARLAFSVAVSVEPDILILDEILSVGDMGFQQRCLARMRALLDTGVSLLFVSHGPDAIKSICQHGLFLHEGSQVFLGSAEQAVSEYVGRVREGINAKKAQAAAASTSSIEPATASPVVAESPDEPEADEFTTVVPGSLRYGSGQAHVVGVRLTDERGVTTQDFHFKEMAILDVQIEARERIDHLDCAFVVRDGRGVDLIGTSIADERRELPPLEPGQRRTARFQFRNPLRQGHYGISITLTALPTDPHEPGETLDHVDAYLAYRVLPDNRRPVRHKMYLPIKADWFEPRATSEPQQASQPEAELGPQPNAPATPGS